ncbi:MAG: transcriptional regulator, TetR family [Planctomycetaceae bacterium]|nr:transcriptional regulator, TetR family [Planctomycetaceae bacterium]
MRITAEEKNATRRRILDAAVELFRTHGFDATTTRDIARAAEIATGTLFNYFDTKEAIIGQLASESFGKARLAFAKQELQAGLDEELFALVVAELRQLKLLRKFITPLLETVLCPLASARRPGMDHSLRVEHLELVVGIAKRHGITEISPVSIQMYWSIYIGVLAFWAEDQSPKQEDTLALLDQSLRMFAAWLLNSAGESQ